MSVSSFTYCISCNEKASEIGDGGMLGFPDLAVRKDYNEDWGTTTYSFGWIVDGLKSISLLPSDVEAYRQFLQKHDGHDVRLGNDHMDAGEFPSLDEDNITVFEPDLDGLVTGTVEFTCTAAGETCQTSIDSERFSPIEARQLSSDDVKNFLERLTAPECFDNITCPSPSVDPYADLENVLRFLKRHQNDVLTVRLIPRSK